MQPTVPSVLTSASPTTLPIEYAVLLDGHGHAQPVTAAEIADGSARPPDGGFAWLHVQRDADGIVELLTRCGLEPIVIEALRADETRPRCTVHGEGVLLNLRGVNLNPGAEPEDMISVRLWLTADRVVGVWVRPLDAVRDLIGSVERRQAPVSPGDLVSKLALRLSDRAEPSVAALNEGIDAMEELILDPFAPISRPELSAIRRSAILLRRYMVPQRDALTTLEIEDLEWLQDRDRSRLREAAERVFRLGEDLDQIRDRAQVIHDQIMDRRAERMNRQMLVLSVVAAIFLPLGLLTGLLGINVGGVPGAGNPGAFWIVCAGLLVLALVLLWVFRRLGMFR